MGRKTRGGQIKCFNCGEHGHSQASCPAYLASGDGSAACIRRRCFTCGSEEHESASCPLNRHVPRTTPQQCEPSDAVKVRELLSSEAPADAPPFSRMSVVVTTSPVPSNPSTMMLEAVLKSFHRVRGLSTCPLVIVCDGYNLAKKSTYKAGKVTEEYAARYGAYLENLKSLLHSGGLPGGTTLVLLDGRHGQSLAVKAGLEQVRTPYVLIHQHDLEFMFDFNVDRVLDVLDDEENEVKYIGMPLLCNLNYEHYAWTHHKVKVSAIEVGQLPVVPIVFWYDSTHVTSVRHYFDVVFGCGVPFKAGDFIEETFGVCQRKDIMDNGMSAHGRYGTYHLISHSADGSRRPIICHLGGNRFLTPEQRAERGYPAEQPVEAYPCRITTHKSKRKVGPLLDLMLQFAGVAVREEARAIKELLNCQLHIARLRGSVTVTQCLAETSVAKV